MKSLLIVWHSRTGATEQMVGAARESAAAVEGVRVNALPAEQASAADVMAADALLFAAPENLASLSGAMKEFLDRSYYDLLDRCNGKAFATIICAGSDGEGAQRQLDRIAQGLRLQRVAPAIIINTDAQTREAILAPKKLGTADLARGSELGALLAEGLAMGIF
ncbi:MAG TPA: NAD(P)H-dependent oxidoreductase [Dokdonella sp.]|uniref:flavodoxin family protein n=1 Tax=Dokdonella sp. TaxID=2291710 RepID=UPI002D7ED2CE|nr:NAD(P)H-dependent oxidoreductase [Dokdonella sp.]HET9032132.1 NAD(P)H-dependent oxidoreductase [Dokdonella sp.]